VPKIVKGDWFESSKKLARLNSLKTSSTASNAEFPPGATDLHEGHVGRHRHVLSRAADRERDVEGRARRPRD
jgi:hypothetical protein